MCNALRRDQLPDRRVVIRLDFTGFRAPRALLAAAQHGEAEICKTYPGLDEDLYITADAEAFVKWHAGQCSWAEATRDSRIQLDGPSWLVRAFPTWNARSMFAHITPGLVPPPRTDELTRHLATTCASSEPAKGCNSAPTAGRTPGPPSMRTRSAAVPQCAGP